MNCEEKFKNQDLKTLEPAIKRSPPNRWSFLKNIDSKIRLSFFDDPNSSQIAIDWTKKSVHSQYQEAAPMNQDKLLSTIVYQVILDGSVFVSLFLFDISRAALSKQWDGAIDAILTTIFLILATDFVLECATYTKYIGSGFFWMDLIGTLTLLTDLFARVARLAKNQKEQFSKKTLEQKEELQRPQPDPELLCNCREHKLCTFCFLGIESSCSVPGWKKDNSNEKKSVDINAKKKQTSKVGTKVVGTIIQNITLVILASVVILFLLTFYENERYDIFNYCSQFFQEYYTKNGMDTTLNDLVERFIAKYPEVVTLTITESYIYAQKSTDKFRSNEIQCWKSNNVLLQVSVYSEVRLRHIINIALLALMISLFVGLTITISFTLQKLIVIPLERMTKIIQEFTRNVESKQKNKKVISSSSFFIFSKKNKNLQVCLLGGDFEDQDKILSEWSEIQVIEHTIKTLCEIFKTVLSSRTKSAKYSLTISSSCNSIKGKNPNLCQEDTSQNFSCQKKGSTFIKSRESVIRINVTEEQRVRLRKSEIQRQLTIIENSHGLRTLDLTNLGFPELASLNVSVRAFFFFNFATLDHPIAAEYLKLYCKAHHTVPLYNFVKAVQTYRKNFKEEFSSLFRSFISENSNYAIGVNSRIRADLEEKFKKRQICVSSFDYLQMEALNCLEIQFRQFVSSNYALAYCKSRNTKSNYKT
ncbi:hypothetical protein RFI_27444 [Reticulomyxa filosa]|uniref:RGS domain-containing protein n=1 Tax=Reticulomyxa filosa TaxID=46433 RepID=X6M7Q3_RETFI|nr:hypothetical protein RFI_27444 [Reticulomyxa filosa]|eukprot:ETO09934.1 hypothetical protein RFI_27444 [Reticulomyxa filosa]